jgi:hypothetical protein
LESNWRFDVWRLVGGGTKLRLVARDLRDQWTYVTDDPDVNPGSYRQWRDPLHIGFLVPDVATPKPDPTAGFPYGVAVAPDKPM